MSLALERSFRDLPEVPFTDEAWPKDLHGNALRVFRLDG